MLTMRNGNSTQVFHTEQKGPIVSRSKGKRGNPKRSVRYRIHPCQPHAVPICFDFSRARSHRNMVNSLPRRDTPFCSQFEAKRCILCAKTRVVDVLVPQKLGGGTAVFFGKSYLCFSGSAVSDMKLNVVKR